MKMNWKLRFQNKVTLTAIVLQIVAIIYVALSMAGITPAIGEQAVTDFALMVIELFSLLGIVVDPTTPGSGDSDRALDRKRLGDV